MNMDSQRSEVTLFQHLVCRDVPFLDVLALSSPASLHFSTFSL